MSHGKDLARCYQQAVEARGGGLDVLHPLAAGAVKVTGFGVDQFADAELFGGGIIGHRRWVVIEDQGDSMFALGDFILDGAQLASMLRRRPMTAC